MMRLLCFLPLLFLVACASVQKTPPSDISSKTPASIQSWSMDGRIGVQSAEGAWHANLYWEHAPEQDRLRISGPLSQGLVSIIVQKDLIYLNEGNGVTSLSRDPDAMLRQRLGFAIPLTSLRYWMLGVSDPGKKSVPLAAGGFQQAGWEIAPDKLTTVAGWTLPQKLRVQGAGVKLKILADSWDIKG